MEKYERLQSLLALLRDKYGGGTTAGLARKIEKADSYVGRLFYPREKKGAKGIGMDLADACTIKLDLPRGFWDMTREEAEAALGMRTAPVDGASTQILPSAHEIHSEASDVVIRQFETGGSMGKGVVLAEQPGVIKEWRVSEQWAQQNVHRVTSIKNLAIVTGFGPSMQPLFNPGDPLLVDRGVTRADVDGIYFFRVGDEGFVKQLQRIPTEKGLVLRAKSYNQLYDSFDITVGMDFEVFARVVKVWRGEEF